MATRVVGNPIVGPKNRCFFVRVLGGGRRLVRFRRGQIVPCHRRKKSKKRRR